MNSSSDRSASASPLKVLGVGLGAFLILTLGMTFAGAVGGLELLLALLLAVVAAVIWSRRAGS